MKIRLKETPEQIELIKAVGSKDKLVSLEAAEALAAFIAPVAQKVLSVAGSTNLIYTQVPYDEDDSPSIPLDLYYLEPTGYITVWSQSIAGGLPSSQVAGVDELKVATYRLDSSCSMLKRYARKARLDVVAKTISRMLQEVLLKQERNGWAVILKALAEARTNSLEHIIDATTNDVFQVDDLNRLMTRIRRINLNFDGGTPADFDSKGLTNLFVSPEIMEQVRAFAYQPMNTRAIPNTDESTAVPLPDNMREQIYRSAGMQEIYGVGLTEILELGDSQKYNYLFDSYYSGSVTMAYGTDQILVGVDLTREGCLSPIARNAESGATFTAQADDQYVTRQDKVGWFGSTEQGNVVIDSRCLVGIVV